MDDKTHFSWPCREGPPTCNFFKEKSNTFSFLKKTSATHFPWKNAGNPRRELEGNWEGNWKGTGKGKGNWKNTALHSRWRKGTGKTQHFQSRPGKGTGKGNWKPEHFQLRPGKGIGKTQHFQSRPRKGVGKTQELQSCLRNWVGKAQQLQSRLRKGNGRRPEVNQQSARNDKTEKNKLQTRKNNPSHSLRSCWPPLPVL